jgi:hypothetical protein
MWGLGGQRALRASTALTAAEVVGALREAGLTLRADDVRIERHGERWLATLPDGQAAWFPASGEGWRRLVRERRVLRLLSERCAVRAPRVLFESSYGFDLREQVPGAADGWSLYRRLLRDERYAMQTGRAIGEILADQHTRIARDEVDDWLPQHPTLPAADGLLDGRLAALIADAKLLTEVRRVIRLCDGTPIDATDRVLIHGDFGLRKIATDPATGAVNGMFGYADAACGDRHHDFRGLVFTMGTDALLEAALQVYEPATGRRLDRRRIWLYNAACAASHLALAHDASGHGPWESRVLAQDLEWLHEVLARV